MINTAVFFKKILIPVDFSINTEVAVKKAVEFAERGTNIYLLHVRGGVGLPVFGKNTNNVTKPENKLNEWKNTIIESGNSSNVFSIIINDRSVQTAIVNTAKKLNADLVIIGKNSNHKWLSFLNTVIPSKIAKETGSVVLTLKPGGIYNKVKTVIVPITNENAFKKADIIQAICKRGPVKIQLLAFLNDDEKREDYYAAVILKLYQSLKTSLNCQVEYEIVRKASKARTILDYAKKYNADILVVNPETETKVGWPNKYLSDLLPVDSKLQVWAV